MESSVYTNSTLILEALLKGYDRRIRPDVKGELKFWRNVVKKLADLGKGLVAFAAVIRVVT